MSRRGRFSLMALGLTMLSAVGCSLVLDSKAEQCSRDADCQRFGDAICEAARNICVARTGGGGGTDPGGRSGQGTPDAQAAAGEGGRAGASDAGNRAGETGSDGSVATGELCATAAGCATCPAGAAEVPLLNTCGESECIPFDNRTRLKNALPDGSLRPLPPRPTTDAGVR